MTSGTIGSLPSSTTTGTRFYKTWTGGDGRTESYAGGTRTKWNNYSCTIFRRSWAHRDLTFFRPGSCGNYWVNTTYTIASVNPVVGWSANDELKLQQKLLSGIKSHDFNLAVNLAQTKQVTSMVDSNLRKLGRAALALRRGDFSTAARQLGAKPKSTRLKTSDVSGRWLELQYGWMPLIKDTYEASKAFEAISQGPRSSTVRTSRSVKLHREIGFGTSDYFLIDVDETYRKSIQYEMYEEMTVERQLGLMDPLSVGWEILPWSFVVDWFIPIGTYLENLNQIPKLRGRFLTTAVTRQRWSNQRRHPTANEPCRQQFTGWVPCSQERVILSRTVSTTLSVPFPRFRGQGAVHGNRVWNAIALAQQAFTGRIGRRR
jgi:hypothetical protein